MKQLVNENQLINHTKTKEISNILSTLTCYKRQKCVEKEDMQNSDRIFERFYLTLACKDCNRTSLSRPSVFIASTSRINLVKSVSLIIIIKVIYSKISDFDKHTFVCKSR